MNTWSGSIKSGNPERGFIHGLPSAPLPSAEAPPDTSTPDKAAALGAAVAKAAVVKLFDKGDGNGVDWKMAGAALFRAAFAVLDALPDDQKDAMARRVYERAEERITGGYADGAAPDPFLKPDASDAVAPVATGRPPAPRPPQ